MNTSTKPFRRAGALVITYFYLLFMTAYIAGCTGIARLTGTTFVIDPLESPLLDRTRRILHARDTKKRDKELKLAAKHRDERQHEAITAMSKEHTDRKREDQAHHKELITFWDNMFDAANAKEIAELEEAKRLKAIAEKDEARKRREREQAMWDKAEAERLKKFQEDQIKREKAQKAERIRLDAQIQKEKKELELYYASAQQYGTDALTAAGGLKAPVDTRYDLDNLSHAEHTVAVHSVYKRMKAKRSSKAISTYARGEKIIADGWMVGEELYGNPIWLHVRPKDSELGGWVWGGALEHWSVAGLERMDDGIKITGAKFSQDSLNAFDKLSEMHANPKRYELENKLAALRAERKALDAPTPLKNQFGTIDAGMITADRIYVGDLKTLRKPTVDSLREKMDRLILLSVEDLNALQKGIRTAFSVVADEEEVPTHATVDTMTELANMKDTVTAEIDRRASITGFTQPKSLADIYHSSSF